MNNIQETGFHSMMKQLYGDFGVDSEVGRLRSVLMRRPGKEIEGITDPAAVAMKEIWDVGKVREEHDALAEIYRSNGVEVHYIEEMAPHLPNAVYARDLVLMTPEGAIVARPAAGCRIGEEVYAARQLAKLGVPIIKTINGDGIFDGACCLWMDRKTCMLGYGKRCNPSAAAQVEEELRNMGVEHLIKVEIPRGMAHLDSFMAFADLKVALVLKIAAPDTIYRVGGEGVQHRGYPGLRRVWALLPEFRSSGAGQNRHADRLSEDGKRTGKKPALSVCSWMSARS